MNLNRLAAAIAVATLFAASSAHAESPPMLPIQGALYDADGLTVDETVTMTFALYTSSDAVVPIWTEVQAVAVREGAFAAYLGASTSLDLDVFAEHADVFVGITIEDDVEMPRIRLATAPFAAWADHAGDSDTVGGFTTDDLIETTLAEADARYVAIGEPTPWTLLSGVPAGFADDVDDDSLAVLGCDEGEFPVVGEATWECARLAADLADGDSDVVAALGCADGQFPAVAGGLWSCASLPVELIDGDDDTLESLGCTAGQYAVRLAAGWGCTSLPDGIADGDDDLLASLGCADGDYAARVDGAWVCAPFPPGVADGDDDLLASLGCVEGEYAARIGGRWACTSLAADLADGDDDLLASLGCAEGEYAAVVAGRWSCGALAAGFADGVDNDVLGGLTCADGQHASYSAGAWRCTSLPVELADGDNDLLASIACPAGNLLASSGGGWQCFALPPGFADGVDNDTFAGLSCPEGQVLKSTGAGWTCAFDIDTDTDTDTRCDVAGRCGQVCIGTDCRASWPSGGPVVTTLGQNFTGSSLYVSPVSTPLSLTAIITTYGGNNCSGRAEVRWLNSGGGEVLGWTLISATNTFSGGDGGSGMYDTELATIPFIAGSSRIEFRGTGCHGYYSAYLIALTHMP